MPYFKSQGRLVTVGQSPRFLAYTDSPKEYEFVAQRYNQSSNYYMVKLMRWGNKVTWISNTGQRRLLVFDITNLTTPLVNFAISTAQINGDCRSAALNAAHDKVYIAWYSGSVAPFVPYLNVYSYPGMTQLYRATMDIAPATSAQLFDIAYFSTGTDEYLIIPLSIGMRIYKIGADGISFTLIKTEAFAPHGVHVIAVEGNESIIVAAHTQRYRIYLDNRPRETLSTLISKFADVRYPYWDTASERMFLGSNGNSALQVFNTLDNKFSEFIRHSTFYSNVGSAITYNDRLYIGSFAGNGAARILEFKRI